MHRLYTTIIALIATISMMAQGWPANYGGVMLQGFIGIRMTIANGLPLRRRLTTSPAVSVSFGFHRAVTVVAIPWDTMTCGGLTTTTVPLVMRQNCAQ